MHVDIRASLTWHWAGHRNAAESSDTDNLRESHCELKKKRVVVFKINLLDECTMINFCCMHGLFHDLYVFRLKIVCIVTCTIVGDIHFRLRCIWSFADGVNVSERKVVLLLALSYYAEEYHATSGSSSGLR